MRTYRRDVLYVWRFMAAVLHEHPEEFAVEHEVALRVAAGIAAEYQFDTPLCGEAEVECRRIREGVDAGIEARDQPQ